MGRWMQGVPRTRVSVLVAAGFMLGALLAVPAAAQVPDTFSNLKVLPPDISKKDLIDTMKAFAMGLGVRCWYCHEGEGDDLSTFKFPSDVKAQKLIARDMLRMTMQINQETIGKLPGREDGESRERVRCMTCHRGAARPVITP